MPAMDIIGYLWTKRQSFSIDTPAQVLRLAADLYDAELDCLNVEDQLVLGQKIGVSTSYPRRTEEEWDELVHEAILKASVAETVHMMSTWESDGS